MDDSDGDAFELTTVPEPSSEAVVEVETPLEAVMTLGITRTPPPFSSISSSSEACFTTFHNTNRQNTARGQKYMRRTRILQMNAVMHGHSRGKGKGRKEGEERPNTNHESPSSHPTFHSCPIQPLRPPPPTGTASRFPPLEIVQGGARSCRASGVRGRRAR